MSLEGLKAFFEIGGVVLLLFTFAFGAGALIVNNRLNAIQAKELGDFKIKFEGEQQKTALAQKEAAEAKQIAGGFEIAISTANREAAEANAKAEGFRLDIANANERAASAEQRAAEATLELARFKAPRSLTHIPELIASLEPFKGTEYMFSFVFQDEDSTKLLRALDDVLQRAKWKRVKSQGRFPALEFWGKGGDAVSVGIGTGIAISVESRESLATLQSRQITGLPEYIKAAVALNLSLSSCLSPPQAPSDNKLVDVQPGDSPVLLIGIGKKP
jgi:hypothetical protein